MVPFILNLDIRRKSVASFMSLPFYHEESTRVHTRQEDEWEQESAWTLWRKEKLPITDVSPCPIYNQLRHLITDKLKQSVHFVFTVGIAATCFGFISAQHASNSRRNTLTYTANRPTVN